MLVPPDRIEYFATLSNPKFPMEKKLTESWFLPALNQEDTSAKTH